MQTSSKENPQNRISAVIGARPIVIISTRWNAYYVNKIYEDICSYISEDVTKDKMTSVVLRNGEEKNKNIVDMKVPGHMDLISGCRVALRKYNPSAIICVAVLIKGESDIYDAHCQAVSTGLANLSSNQDVPIIQAVLMCRDEKQAYVRTHEQNPGKAHAVAAIDMIELNLEEEVTTR